MVRLGLDTSLDEITSGSTDSDVVFDLIEWAERCDNVPALIQIAAESNNQNRALQQLKQGASAWFTADNVITPTAIPLAGGPSATPTVVPQSYSPTGDIIIANIGGESENIVVGKNVQQSTGGTKLPKQR